MSSILICSFTLWMVALIAPNIPEALECALALPMIGAVLNANNVRLDAGTIAYILDHGEAKILLVDSRDNERLTRGAQLYDIVMEGRRTRRAGWLSDMCRLVRLWMIADDWRTYPGSRLVRSKDYNA